MKQVPVLAAFLGMAVAGLPMLQHHGIGMLLGQLVAGAIVAFIVTKVIEKRAK